MQRIERSLKAMLAKKAQEQENARLSLTETSPLPYPLVNLCVAYTVDLSSAYEEYMQQFPQSPYNKENDEKALAWYQGHPNPDIKRFARHAVKNGYLKMLVTILDTQNIHPSDEIIYDSNSLLLKTSHTNLLCTSMDYKQYGITTMLLSDYPWTSDQIAWKSFVLTYGVHAFDQPVLVQAVIKNKVDITERLLELKAQPEPFLIDLAVYEGFHAITALLYPLRSPYSFFSLSTTASLVKNYSTQPQDQKKLELIKQKIADELNAIPFSLDHRERIATVRSVLQNAPTLQKIMDVVNNQMLLFQGFTTFGRGNRFQEIPELGRFGRSLKNRPVDYEQSDYYKALKNIAVFITQQITLSFHSKSNHSAAAAGPGR